MPIVLGITVIESSTCHDPPRPAPPLKLSAEERKVVHDTLLIERFVDQAPPVLWPPCSSFLRILRPRHLNILVHRIRCVYLCAERTMYRLLKAHHQIRERRRLRHHGHFSKPELLVTTPNQVWSWDITKLKGPVKWSYFYLYVILDIYSRYVVGWMIADQESALLAKTLIRESRDKQDIEPDQFTLHADRGPCMKSKAVAHLLADLGITKTHSRPYTSDDNPYSEA